MQGVLIIFNRISLHPCRCSDWTLKLSLKVWTNQALKTSQVYSWCRPRSISSATCRTCSSAWLVRPLASVVASIMMRPHTVRLQVNDWRQYHQLYQLCIRIDSSRTTHSLRTADHAVRPSDRSDLHKYSNATHQDIQCTASFWSLNVLRLPKLHFKGARSLLNSINLPGRVTNDARQERGHAV